MYQIIRIEVDNGVMYDALMSYIRSYCRTHDTQYRCRMRKLCLPTVHNLLILSSYSASKPELNLAHFAHSELLLCLLDLNLARYPPSTVRFGKCVEVLFTTV